MGLKKILKKFPIIKQYNEKFESLYIRLDNLENMLKSMEARQIKSYIDIMQNGTGRGYIYDKIKEITNRLKVCDAPVNYFRAGRDNDGGYVMADCLQNTAAAYSLGICDDVSWDIDIAKRGIEIFMYDHTIENLPEHNPRFHFFKTGIGTENTGELKTLETIISENNHNDCTNLILKMDIEGCEWEVLDQATCLSQFSQIAVELHGLCDLDNELVTKVLDKLSITHTPVHIHANNCSPVLFYGGLTLPDALEVTYLRKTDFEFSPCTRVFPTEFDMVNDPARPEIIINF